jgi:hypothetical protein
MYLLLARIRNLKPNTCRWFPETGGSTAKWTRTVEPVRRDGATRELTNGTVTQYVSDHHYLFPRRLLHTPRLAAHLETLTPQYAQRQCAAAPWVLCSLNHE